MRVAVVVAALVLSACVPRSASRATTGVALGFVACDWAQTRGAAEGGWNDIHENNPLLGRAPSPGSVNVYMAAVAFVLLAASELAPPPVALALDGIAIGVEARTIHRNMHINNRLPLCR